MKRLFDFFLIFFGFTSPLVGNEATKRFTIYYHENLPNEVYAPYSLIVLEGDQHPDLSYLLENNKTVLGYLNLGEVSKDKSYFKELKKEGVLLQPNAVWKDSYMIDFRNKLWTKRVIEELIPDLLFQHFSGIFLDTVDNASYLNEKYNGMEDAAVKLIKTIRLNYPKIPIMMNRGFAILPKVAKDIDMVLAESILVEHDFKTNTNRLLPDSQYNELVKELKEAQKINPKLEVYTLDYWDEEDKEGIKKIYEIQRKNGFIPYVSTIELNKIIQEPA